MTRDEVRAAATARVTRWHERFAGLFGRKEPQGHSLVYLKGLMSEQKRKSVEPIALQFAQRAQRHGGDAERSRGVAGIPHPLSLGGKRRVPGNSSGLRGRVGAHHDAVAAWARWACSTKVRLQERRGPKASALPGSGAAGWERPRTARWACSWLGVTPGGVAGLDAQLFLTETWAADRKRRKKTRVPRQIKFQTKPQIRRRNAPADAGGGARLSLTGSSPTRSMATAARSSTPWKR